MWFLFAEDQASVPLASAETFLILTGPGTGLGEKEVCLAKILQIFVSHSNASPNLRASSSKRFLLYLFLCFLVVFFWNQVNSFILIKSTFNNSIMSSNTWTRWYHTSVSLKLWGKSPCCAYVFVTNQCGAALCPQVGWSLSPEVTLPSPGCPQNAAPAKPGTVLPRAVTPPETQVLNSKHNWQ